ncbi:cutinase family protein [Mycobacterium asiaticum]|uniref:cutinase family protein n=1 Tax=Mycobacterium asiaticum TaxID=1790 RepID=UPI0012DB0287
MRRTGSPTPSFSRVAPLLAAVVLATLALVAAPAAVLAHAGADPGCPDVDVVFARGTFEAPGVGATGQAFVDALNARLAGKNVAVDPVNYPASLDFNRAVDGVADASSKVEATAANCPNTKIVLGGYSQGAAVAAYTTSDSVPDGVALPDGVTGPMPPAVASKVAAVVLFAPPSDWFLHLVDRSAPPINIGSLYAPKTLQLCVDGDPVCSPGGRDRAAHSTYRDNGMANQAADYARNAIVAHGG